MFLKTNDRIVNLKNVSNINILKDKMRIVFNLNYSIEINNSRGSKMISDYVYWDAVDSEDFHDNIVRIKSNEFVQVAFIPYVDESGFVNISEISSVKFSEKKNRVIFNLSHPVSFTDFDRNEKITSEFVYVNCPDGTYKEYRDTVQSSLGV